MLHINNIFLFRGILMKNTVLLLSLFAVSNVVVAGCGCGTKPETKVTVEAPAEDAAVAQAKKKAEEATKQAEQAPTDVVVETAEVEDNKA